MKLFRRNKNVYLSDINSVIVFDMPINDFVYAT